MRDRNKENMTMPDNVNDNGTNNDDNSGGNNGGTPNADTTDKNWRALEEKANANQTRADRMMKAAVDNVAKGAGVDPAKGTGSLIVEKYVSSLSADDVPTDEHFKNFLEENEYQVSSPSGNGGDNNPDNSQLLDKYQNVGDRLRNNSNEPAPAEINNVIAQAEQQGNWEYAAALKFNQQIANSPHAS